MIIVTNTLLGWEVEVERTSDNERPVYYVQFDKYRGKSLRAQVQLIMIYNENETKFISMQFNATGQFNVDLLKFNINHYKQASNDIQKTLSDLSEILDSAKS